MIQRDARAALGQDHRAGASELVAFAAAACRAALAETGPDPAPLARALRRVCHAQPSMGAVLRLASRVLEVAETAKRRGDDAGHAEDEISLALDQFVADFEDAGHAIVEHGLDVFPASGWAATHSRSSLVEAVFLEVARRHKPVQVLLSESRPLLEGRDLARRLAEAKIPCWLTVDAAAALLLPRAAVLLVGADAVLPKTFVNKVGTYALLLAARELNVPAYALAQCAKFLPASVGLFELGERDPEQVWKDGALGVSVRNPTFEECPLGLVRGVIAESGVLLPNEAGVAAGETSLAEPLLAPWSKADEVDED